MQAALHVKMGMVGRVDFADSVNLVATDADPNHLMTAVTVAVGFIQITSSASNVEQGVDLVTDQQNVTIVMSVSI